jgi:hypothetical protein
VGTPVAVRVTLGVSVEVMVAGRVEVGVAVMVGVGVSVGTGRSFSTRANSTAARRTIDCAAPSLIAGDGRRGVRLARGVGRRRGVGLEAGRVGRSVGVGVAEAVAAMVAVGGGEASCWDTAAVIGVPESPWRALAVTVRRSPTKALGMIRVFRANRTPGPGSTDATISPVRSALNPWRSAITL